MNHVQCPYSGGYSLPQCFTHPSPTGIDHWDICVSEINAIDGGSFTYRIDYGSPIKQMRAWNVVECDGALVSGNSFSVPCHCAGHCGINGMWTVWF